MSEVNFGLQPLKPDRRDIQLGALYFLPKLEELPESFELINSFPIKHQQDTDYCTAFATCGMSELQEDVELFPPYSFAASKELSGDLDAWGQDLRSAMKSHQKLGAIEVSDTPEDIKGTPYRDLRVYDDYPVEMHQKALKHKKQAYVSLSKYTQYDWFDRIRASIWHFREEKRAVAIGVVFGWGIGQEKLELLPDDNGFGHAMYITGWKGEYLISPNSYGESAGNKGKHLISRDVINKYAGRFGAFMMIDLSPDMAKELQRRALFTKASLLGKIWLWIKEYLYEIFR